MSLLSRRMFAWPALGLAVALAAGAWSQTAAAREIIVQGPPPPARVEHMPPGRPGAIWDPGHWAWNGRDYQWVPGHWQPVMHGRRWVPGHWVARPRGWVWMEGHWTRR